MCNCMIKIIKDRARRINEIDKFTILKTDWTIKLNFFVASIKTKNLGLMAFTKLLAKLLIDKY
jgi:hypothetical protein